MIVLASACERADETQESAVAETAAAPAVAAATPVEAGRYLISVAGCNMSDADARAIYQYLRSLGPKGEHVPAPVPPDQEPATAYLDLDPVPPAGS